MPRLCSLIALCLFLLASLSISASLQAAWLLRNSSYDCQNVWAPGDPLAIDLNFVNRSSPGALPLLASPVASAYAPRTVAFTADVSLPAGIYSDNSEHFLQIAIRSPSCNSGGCLQATAARRLRFRREKSDPAKLSLYLAFENRSNRFVMDGGSFFSPTWDARLHRFAPALVGGGEDPPLVLAVDPSELRAAVHVTVRICRPLVIWLGAALGSNGVDSALIAPYATVIRGALTLVWLSCGVASLVKEFGFWRGRTSFVGVSLWSHIIHVLSILLLYMHTPSAIKIALVVFACGELWKISKMIKLSLQFPFVRRLEGYPAGTNKIDREGLLVFVCTVVPAICGLAWYRPNYGEFWENLMFYVTADLLYVFPQLYVNWRLKTVVGISVEGWDYSFAYMLISNLVSAFAPSRSLDEGFVCGAVLCYAVWLFQCLCYGSSAPSRQQNVKTEHVD
jgi:hypothetical protein